MGVISSVAPSSTAIPHTTETNGALESPSAAISIANNRWFSMSGMVELNTQSGNEMR